LSRSRRATCLVRILKCPAFASRKRQRGCHVVASIDVERCAAKIMAKFTRRNLHAWVKGCFGAESEKWSGNRPFQRRGLGSTESGVGIRAGTEGPGGGRCVRGRTGVFRSPANCGSGAEFAGGMQLPNLS